MKWRPTLRALHRDIGYFLATLVCVYAISGAAVNHIDDFNPSYAIHQTDIAIGPVAGDLDAMQTAVVQTLKLDPTIVKGRHLAAPTTLIVFLVEGGEVRLNPLTGVGRLKLVTPRRPLFDFNILHLNHVKGAWTWFADAFALLLFTLAVTGLLMLRGKLGLAGRGKWFVLAGAVVPIGFLAAHYASQ